MPTIDPSFIKKTVDKRLPKSRTDTLYELSKGWRNLALRQTVKNIQGKTKVPSLVDKLSSEVIEAEGAFGYYSKSSKQDKYSRQSIEECVDVGNMGLILMPVIFDPNSIKPGDFPDYSEMLVSIGYHNKRYKFAWVMPFDLSANYSNKELFEIYIKTIDAMILQQSMKFPDVSERRADALERFHSNYIMLHHDIDQYLEQNHFKHLAPPIEMSSKWVRMSGDMITHSLLLFGEIPEASYERYFRMATEKMRRRDLRYHVLNRLDEKST